ncbi:MAG: ABC transporter ATP-binding protein [Rhizobacter sp.]|nr:ABC transporter ATP-binding protein [Rhizobacter sp.]
MELTLARVDKQVGPQTHLYPLDLTLAPRAVTVLLGATQAGKTTLMRLMAGLDTPSHGTVSVDGRDVTGVPVRERNVAMVYQQFINYPSMSVYDNIASPLKLRGEKDIAARVQALAAKLHIEPFLKRLPAELSGGQQQRVALARALAKNAPLMLLDEPLVNLDYKLREELRDELTQLFAAGDSTVVYATTEPTEALLLGGYTAVMDAGELLQYGPTAEVFHRPASIRVARAFSDPPMNLVDTGAAPAASTSMRADATSVRPDATSVRPDATSVRADATSVRAELVEALRQAQGERVGGSAPVTLGIRASALHVQQRPGDVALPGRVELAEISGSDTFVHVDTPVGELVAQLTGVHFFDLGAHVTLYLHPSQVYVFDAGGALLVAPTRETT